MPIEFPFPPAGDEYTLQSDFTDHRTTDRFRWQDFYDSQLELYEQIASSQGLKPDKENNITFPQGSPYTVTDTYGGLLTVTALNENGFYAAVALPGGKSWNSSGLIEGVQVTKYFRLLPGDVVQVDNASSLTFTPAVPDPESTLSQIVAMMNVAIDNVYAASIEEAKRIYAGTTPNYDYTQPTKVMGSGGLITIGGSDGWTVPKNGALIVTYSAIIGAAKSVLVDSETVWTAVLSLLGANTTKSPSDPIQVSTGQVVTATGLLGVGESLDVTFYPNAGA